MRAAFHQPLLKLDAAQLLELTLLLLIDGRIIIIRNEIVPHHNSQLALAKNGYAPSLVVKDAVFLELQIQRPSALDVESPLPF